jgi:hypothetical protein
VYTLAEQIEQLRGRELPGFMSSQVGDLQYHMLYMPCCPKSIVVTKERTLGPHSIHSFLQLIVGDWNVTMKLTGSLSPLFYSAPF